MEKIKNLDCFKRDTEELTKNDYCVEKEWHGLCRIPSVDIIDVFKGAFDKRETFDVSAWEK